jgi:hypothetical protein
VSIRHDKRRGYCLACDRPGCNRTIWATSPQAARDLARREHWLEVGLRDYCGEDCRLAPEVLC